MNSRFIRKSSIKLNIVQNADDFRVMGHSKMRLFDKEGCPYLRCCRYIKTISGHLHSLVVVFSCSYQAFVRCVVPQTWFNCRVYCSATTTAKNKNFFTQKNKSSGVFALVANERTMMMAAQFKMPVSSSYIVYGDLRTSVDGGEERKRP
jgi:hypothetical protein